MIIVLGLSSWHLSQSVMLLLLLTGASDSNQDSTTSSNIQGGIGFVSTFVCLHGAAVLWPLLAAYAIYKEHIATAKLTFIFFLYYALYHLIIMFLYFIIGGAGALISEEYKFLAEIEIVYIVFGIIAAIFTRLYIKNISLVTISALEAAPNSPNMKITRK